MAAYYYDYTNSSSVSYVDYKSDNWSTYGQVTDYTIGYDNGSKEVVHFDHNNTANWNSVDYQYNSSAQLTDYTIGWDNGSKDHIYVDNNNASWATIDYQYDSSGHLVDYSITNDDGSSHTYHL